MGKLTIQSFAVMPFDENCYVVSDDTGEGVVIDPGGMAKEILAYIREAKLSIKAVFLRLKWVDVDYEHGVQACGRFAQNGI